ncbi:hypothetical protein MKW98_012088 [Papaver atlanticum]|uniref:Uncharacterized protein n=1 Tax=Papaver atlanticum TaxID=357466 RepID=A0AAD4TEM0_9MAGN|nr:hypothetical protein MKW98_012088 [Papaver atlanticum]
MVGLRSGRGTVHCYTKIREWTSFTLLHLHEMTMYLPMYVSEEKKNWVVILSLRNGQWRCNFHTPVHLVVMFPANRDMIPVKTVDLKKYFNICSWPQLPFQSF